MRTGRDARGRGARQATWLRVTAAVSSAALLGSLGLAGTSMAATGAAAKAAKPAAAADTSSCRLGNGVKHVVEITFDNVHYFRDNPNVPSDLELMPNLLNFFTGNGTFLSNNHTPLIAHTADDILTTLHRPVRRPARHADLQQLPGLQRRRDHRPGRLVRLLDRPGLRHRKTRRTPATTPTRTWSTRRYRRPPRRTVAPNTVTPAPWVPFTRAGCDVGRGRHGQHGAGEHRRRHPQGVRRRLA